MRWSSSSGVIGRQRIGRLEDNATVIAAAPATHLLLVNALRHSGEADWFGTPPFHTAPDPSRPRTAVAPQLTQVTFLSHL